VNKFSTLEEVMGYTCDPVDLSFLERLETAPAEPVTYLS
jgi:hypothetical protein